MAETSNANSEVSRLWSPAVEKQFILLLIEIAAKETGKRKTKDWLAIKTAFNERIRNGKSYSSTQLSDKHKQLRKRYNLFSQLIKSPGMGWDDHYNTVKGNPEAWANALTLNKNFGQLCGDALINCDLLIHLFSMNGQTPSAQPDTVEGGHPTGTNTTSGVKRKAPTFDSVPCESDSFSMANVTSILDSMPDLSMDTYCKALDRLEERPGKRQTLVTMIPERRHGLFYLFSCMSCIYIAQPQTETVCINSKSLK